MPNGIKYSTGLTPSGVFRKGNMLISNNTIETGPTFYTGITPPSGGYTMYLNKANNGPSIYCPANDSQLVSITNRLEGTNHTTAAQCLAYFAPLTDKIVVNFDYEGIVTNGLILNLDAGFDPSYPSTGTTWYDIGGNAYNGTLTNGPTYNSANSGSIFFDGTDDQAPVSSATFNNILNSLSAITVQTWIKPPTSPKQYGGYISRQTSAVSNYTGFSLRQNNLNNGAIEWFGFGSNVNMITGSVTPNVWNLATATWNGTVMTLYINGSQASTRTNSTNVMSASGQTFTIGKLSYGNFPQTFDMASVQIYNRALTAAEVLQNYNAQKSRFGL